MSEKAPSILQQLKMQHANFCTQRDQAKINFQQMSGAVFACETMIKQYEASVKQDAEMTAQESANMKSDDDQGAINDGQTNSETTEQTSQK